SRPSMPSAVVATPSRAARAKPSDSGSMPTSAAISRLSPWRRILIIRSVPILPEPITATLTLLLTFDSVSAGLTKGSGDTAQSLNICLEHVSRLGRHHRPQRPGHQYATRTQRAVVANHGVGQPDGSIQRV